MATIERHVTRSLIALDASAPCSEAASLMASRTIGAVAVQQNGRTIGLVTERDLAVRVVATGAPPSLPVGEAMRKDLPPVPDSITETECAAIMRDHTTRHLLVEKGGEVVGVISMRDVIRLMLEDKQFLIDQLQTYIDGR